MGQHDGAIDKIAEYGHQLTVVASLEILPAEIIVLGLRSVGREDIPDDILFAREIAEILVGPYRPVAEVEILSPSRLRNSLAGTLSGRNVAVAVGLEH